MVGCGRAGLRGMGAMRPPRAGPGSLFAVRAPTPGRALRAEAAITLGRREQAAVKLMRDPECRIGIFTGTFQDRARPSRRGVVLDDYCSPPASFTYFDDSLV